MRITDTRREPLACKHPDAQFPYPGETFGIAYPLSVPEFGRVYLWADGKGYTSRTHELLLERELATCRYQRSLEFIKQYQRKGVPLAELLARLDAAKPPAQPEGEPLLKSLRESLLAGEEAALAVARFRLGRIGWREAFLWGVVLTDPAIPVQPLHPPFNQLSLSMAQQSPEAWESVVQQAQQERLLVRGESILTAEFVQRAVESSQLLQESLTSRLRDALSLYRGRIRYWEILSDLPDSLHLLAEEHKATASMVATLCEAARAVDFGIVRLLGVRYSLHHPRAAFDLLDRLVESGVPFEGVNLHLYWHDFDLLDFDFVVEHYGELGKPLHLTLHLPPTDPHQAGDFFWRAPISEAVQADWLLHTLIIALSKPFIVGVQVGLDSLAESTIQRMREQHQAWKQGRTP
ncbi:MAG: hypothetical protein ABDI19_01005 [Armatimonadota bacterium]